MRRNAYRIRIYRKFPLAEGIYAVRKQMDNIYLLILKTAEPLNAISLRRRLKSVFRFRKPQLKSEPPIPEAKCL